MCTSGLSICACATPDSASARASIACFMVVLLGGATLLDFAALQQRLRDGARVDVLELAAERHAARDAAHFHAARAQHLGDVMSGGLALVGEVGGEDHLAHCVVRDARLQAV